MKRFSLSLTSLATAIAWFGFVMGPLADPAGAAVTATDAMRRIIPYVIAQVRNVQGLGRFLLRASFTFSCAPLGSRSRCFACRLLRQLLRVEPYATRSERVGPIFGKMLVRLPLPVYWMSA